MYSGQKVELKIFALETRQFLEIKVSTQLIFEEKAFSISNLNAKVHTIGKHMQSFYCLIKYNNNAIAQYTQAKKTEIQILAFDI